MSTPQPQIQFNLPDTIFIGESFNLNLTFENAAPAVIGFLPAYDIILPTGVEFTSGTTPIAIRSEAQSTFSEIILRLQGLMSSTNQPSKEEDRKISEIFNRKIILIMSFLAFSEIILHSLNVK
jgi:hypothetical protein